VNLDKRLVSQAAGVRRGLALTIGTGLLAGIVLVGQARFLSRVVGRVFLAGDGLEQVRPLLLGLLALALARAALVWLGEVAAGRAAGRLKADLRERLAAHLLALGPAYLQGERTGELANTAVEGVEALDAYFSQYLPQLALAALVPLTFLLFVFPQDWLSGLVLLLTAPLIPVFMILIGDLARTLTRRQWAALSRMSAHFLDVLQGLATLKLLGRGQEQTETIARVGERFRETTMGVLRVAFLSALVMELVATISIALVAVQIGLRLLSGRLGFEEAFFILILAPEFYLPLRLLGARHHAAMAGLEAARRIFQVLETEDLSPRPPSLRGKGGSYPPLFVGVGWGVGLISPPSSFHLVFTGVHYAYEDERRPALHGVSFELPPGRHVALVGPSGAGKSTIAHLLLRFIEPQRGTITVDGAPLHEFPPAAWRARVAWVPQNVYLFHASVADNIRLARPDAALDEVVRAARQAHAHQFIQALPQGYETPVGERGARLSGGQAQRIALARAFLKDAPLLILDEPAAHLDPEHEALLGETFARLVQGRTVLTIAHRMSTVAGADRILVLDGGHVVQAVTHAALLEAAGLYRRMVGGDSRLVNWETGKLVGWETGRLVNWETGELGAGKLGTGKLGDQSTDLPIPNLPIHQSTSLPIYQSTNLPIFLRLLQLATPYARWMLLAVLLAFATVASGVGLMAASAYIIAKAALRPSIADLQVAIVGVRFFGIARGVFRYLERYVSHEVNFRLLAGLRVWFYRRLEPLAPARLMHYRSGDVLSRVVADVETLQHVFVRVLAPPLTAALVGLLLCFFLGAYHPALALTWLAFLVLGGLGLPLLVLALGREPGRRMVAVHAELNAAVVDGVQGAAELLAFNAEARHQERIGALSRELAGWQGRMAAAGGLHSALAGLLMSLAALAVLVVAVPLVRGGRIDGVYLALLVLAVMSGFEAIYPLPLAAQYLENSLAAGRRLFEIVDAPPAVVDPPPPYPVPRDYGLAVHDLRFAYAPGEPPALDGVSFDLPPGGRLAVVGPSGAGKSTLANLLLRFWDYREGSILLGGHELREYRQDDLRRLIAVVSQQTHLFNASLRDNLLLARPDAAQADLDRAVQGAQLDEFLRSLPDGYDTGIGEQGLKLSGGQRRRLAIARALLQDAPILVLDEPAAHLDPLTERDVMQAVLALMAGRTTLVITHRLAGLEAMDEILVLRAGRVVERGAHADLWQMGGLYRRMWELQNQVPLEKHTGFS
jgi:ATP-binding cassette subfamily C protein CydCD